MSNKQFNLMENQKAERKLMATYVDVSGKKPQDTNWIPEWEILGAGIEESSVELNADIATTTDILGYTETLINKFEEQQTLEPNTLKGGQKLNAILLDITLRRAYSELSNFTVMRAYQLIGEAEKATAHYDMGCTITPTSLGGSSYLDMPMQVNFSGNRVFGTVDSLKNPVFTEAE